MARASAIRAGTEQRSGESIGISRSIQPDLDLAARKNMVRDPFAEWKRWEDGEDGGADFPWWWTVFGCQAHAEM